MSEFLNMGGFAWFVWPCYGLTAVSMIWLIVDSWRKRAAQRATLASMTTVSAPASARAER